MSSSFSTTPLSSANREVLFFDDEEYPYAGIPRVVIETDDLVDVVDRENKIRAKFQIFGEEKEETDVYALTIVGRGNSSWNLMPKKGYKIEFEHKQTLLGMPKNRDWVLISNYADKTLMKNYLMYNLAASINSYYSPRCRFVELYLNQEYLGTYLLVETIKSGKNRIDFSHSENAYIIEVDANLRSGEQNVVSNVIDENGKKFKIHEPHDIKDDAVEIISNHIQQFETFLVGLEPGKKNQLDSWIDVDEMIRHMWIQEFSKNPDANFYTSVYFSWVKGGVIKMGPVWDFDISFGGHYVESLRTVSDWRSVGYWYKYLLDDSEFALQRKQYWLDNRHIFESVLDSADVAYAMLENTAANNFKRWDILESTENKFHKNSYRSYSEAVEDLKAWIRARLAWIDDNLDEF